MVDTQAHVQRSEIDDFLASKRLAVVGVSRSGSGFGNIARKELAAKGYEVHLVHPEAEAIDGQRCVRHLADLTGEVDAVLLVTPPAETEKLVREAKEAGMKRIWIQQGAESADALKYCATHGLSAVHHECILMFAHHPGFVHRAHRWIRGAFGHLPS